MWNVKIHSGLNNKKREAFRNINNIIKSLTKSSNKLWSLIDFSKSETSY